MSSSSYDVNLSHVDLRPDSVDLGQVQQINNNEVKIRHGRSSKRKDRAQSVVLENKVKVNFELDSKQKGSLKSQSQIVNQVRTT